MPPSDQLHAEISRLLLGRDGRKVQKILDSTARSHGGRHREDAVHSLPGLAAELLRRGELTPEAMVDGAVHMAVDEVWSRAVAGLPVRGPARQPTKQLMEAALTSALRGVRRRRR
ncbi:MAG TPA: hypothetical protein VMG99_08795 [Thermoplasmata archaeon]|nr:hypothetical protein [Thermoplasmata archaeon]